MATVIEVLQTALTRIHTLESRMTEAAQRIQLLEKRVAEQEQKMLSIEQGDCFAGGTPT